MSQSTPPSVDRPIGPAERSSVTDLMATLIAESHLFKSLDSAGREEVVNVGRMQCFEPEAHLIEQGDSSGIMFLILEGKIAVYTDTPGGRIGLAELGPGACVGEVSMLTGGERTATVVAVSAVTAVAFQRPEIDGVLAKYPKVKKMLETLVAARAADTVQKMMGGGS